MSRCLLLIFLITVVSVRSEENQIDDGAIKLFQSIGDHFRFSDQYSSLCSITSNDGKGNIKTQNYKMFVKDARTSLLYTLSPERDRGKMYLMRGKDIWCYFPKAGKSMMISYNRTLMGTVNISDFVNTELTEWYDLIDCDATYTGETPVVILTLKRKNAKAAYPFIKVYFDKNRIIQAESLSSSQILMRKIIYSDFLPARDGFYYATNIRIENSMKSGEYSIIKISSLTVEKAIPEYYFSPDHLHRVIVQTP